MAWITTIFIETFLPKMGIMTTVLDPADYAGLEAALDNHKFTKKPGRKLEECKLKVAYLPPNPSTSSIDMSLKHTDSQLFNCLDCRSKKEAQCFFSVNNFDIRAYIFFKYYLRVSKH
uniref:Uncharacterized protein n=1 Tax=Lactuca sativa TaxID=4236 RepID=A0A9R1W2C3_LACSA|nr:hypothetical protein LSAT_V11C300144150 [Lactuca sativa]